MKIPSLLDVNISPPPPSKPSWKRANKEERQLYEYLLDNYLQTIAIPAEITECLDVKCNDPYHLQAIDAACRDSLPVSNPKVRKNKVSKSLAGFNANVKEHKERALFWFSIWSSAGKPLNNELHNIVKKTEKYLSLTHQKM